MINQGGAAGTRWRTLRQFLASIEHHADAGFFRYGEQRQCSTSRKQVILAAIEVRLAEQRCLVTPATISKLPEDIGQSVRAEKGPRPR